MTGQKSWRSAASRVESESPVKKLRDQGMAIGPSDGPPLEEFELVVLAGELPRCQALGICWLGSSFGPWRGVGRDEDAEQVAPAASVKH